MKINKLLVPIDFSDNALNGLRWGIEVAERSGAQLHILHCYEYSAVYANMDHVAFLDTLAESVTKDILKRMADLKDDLPKLPLRNPRYEVTFGFPVQDITTYVEKNQIDLIVMGTQGKNNITNRLMGSVTSSVIEKTSVPVLAIPENCTPGDMKNILLADDFKSITPDFTLNMVASIASMYNASVKILHVSKEGKNGAAVETEEILKLAKNFKDIPHTYAFTAGKEMDETILDFIAKEASDMLVIMPRKHGFFFTLFQQSVTDRVVHKIKIPMLAIHNVAGVN